MANGESSSKVLQVEVEPYSRHTAISLIGAMCLPGVIPVSFRSIDRKENSVSEEHYYAVNLGTKKLFLWSLSLSFSVAVHWTLQYCFSRRHNRIFAYIVAHAEIVAHVRLFM